MSDQIENPWAIPEHQGKKLEPEQSLNRKVHIPGTTSPLFSPNSLGMRTSFRDYNSIVRYPHYHYVTGTHSQKPHNGHVGHLEGNKSFLVFKPALRLLISTQHTGYVGTQLDPTRGENSPEKKGC